MERGRRLQSDEWDHLVREPMPGYGSDDDDDGPDDEGFARNQAEPTRVLIRGPLSDDERELIVLWMIHRIRAVARIPEEREPTEWEMVVAATSMQCLIWMLDPPPVFEDGSPGPDGAAFVDMSALAALIDIILISPCSGRRYVRKVIHELAHRLMVTEVAREVFWAVEVRIEAPGWDCDRERHKLALRVEERLMGKR